MKKAKSRSRSRRRTPVPAGNADAYVAADVAASQVGATMGLAAVDPLDRLLSRYTEHTLAQVDKLPAKWAATVIHRLLEDIEALERIRKSLNADPFSRSGVSKVFLQTPYRNDGQRMGLPPEASIVFVFDGLVNGLPRELSLKLGDPEAKSGVLVRAAAGVVLTPFGDSVAIIPRSQ